MIKQKLFYYILFILFIFLTILFFSGTITFAAYPKLISKIMTAFDNVKTYIIAMATPVAAVAIGSGFLMQKFSFGDEERIRNGKKLIRTSVISYAFILTLDLIISLIGTLIA